MWRLHLYGQIPDERNEDGSLENVLCAVKKKTHTNKQKRTRKEKSKRIEAMVQRNTSSKVQIIIKSRRIRRRREKNPVVSPPPTHTQRNELVFFFSDERERILTEWTSPPIVPRQGRATKNSRLCQ